MWWPARDHIRGVINQNIQDSPIRTTDAPENSLNLEPVTDLVHLLVRLDPGFPAQLAVGEGTPIAEYSQDVIPVRHRCHLRPALNACIVDCERNQVKVCKQLLARR